MANCTICKKPVLAGKCLHGECWRRTALEHGGALCDDYCRFPRECESQEALDEHCAVCPLNALLGLVTDNGNL